MLRLTGKKTKQLGGEGGSGGGLQLPLVTEPYRDPANEDKWKMVFPRLQASTRVTSDFPVTQTFWPLQKQSRRNVAFLLALAIGTLLRN
jgi:hypothetical protein